MSDSPRLASIVPTATQVIYSQQPESHPEGRHGDGDCWSKAIRLLGAVSVSDKKLTENITTYHRGFYTPN